MLLQWDQASANRKEGHEARGLGPGGFSLLGPEGQGFRRLRRDGGGRQDRF